MDYIIHKDKLYTGVRLLTANLWTECWKTKKDLKGKIIKKTFKSELADDLASSAISTTVAWLAGPGSIPEKTHLGNELFLIDHGVLGSAPG